MKDSLGEQSAITRVTGIKRHNQTRKPDRNSCRKDECGWWCASKRLV